MASRAPDLRKQLLSTVDGVINLSARRCLRGTHEVRESGEVHAVVLRIRNRIVLRPIPHEPAKRGVFSRKKRRGDSHFIEIRIRGKRNQTGVLRLPSKTPDATASIAF